MDLRFPATYSVWRRLFAALITVAFALSFFHGLSFDTDDGAPVMSIAQGYGGTADKTSTDKAPAHPAPIHGDHCLTHLSSVAAQDVSIAIEYVAHSYRLASLQSPDGACPRSPFEPPRA